MKRFINTVAGLLIASNLLVLSQISIRQAPEEKMRQLKLAVYENLTNNILSYWSAKMPDYVNGGFYGRIDAGNNVITEADKGGILNARILWTYSAAYRVTKNPDYLKLATRAKDYILKFFIDKEFGGAYFSLNFRGEPSDTRKHTYTQAFFIYSLSEYSRATGDKESLKAAREIFEIFEKSILDRESNGYYEIFSRDWKKMPVSPTGNRQDTDQKTMNTSLHIMEAYANLYRVWPDKRMEERLRNMVTLFLDRIVDKNRGHLIVFLDRNWNPTSQIDSYGHDIESSWLLYEAAQLTGDKELTARVRETSISIANAALEGIMPDGSMMTEKNLETGHTTVNRSWWEQAESVVGYLNAWELTGDESYLNTAINSWNYIDRYFVDKTNGSWFITVTPDGTGKGDKAGNWLCPYHNSRMCLEVIERFSAGQKE